MAQQDPGQPLTETSYSDPIYDRLEAISHALSRRWPLLLAFFVIAIVAGLLYQQQRESTPEAASATRFLQAQEQLLSEQSTAGLEALLADQAETDEFRARAAMELAQQALLEGDSAAAVDHAEAGLDLVDADQHRVLSLSLQLSLASGKRELGALEEALETLRAIERRADRHPAHKIQARIMQADMLYHQAKAIDEEEASADNQRALLEEALVILEPIQADTDPARRQLRRVASYLFYRIRFEYPSLATDDDRAGNSAVATDPAADGDAAEDDRQPSAGRDDPAPAAEAASD